MFWSDRAIVGWIFKKFDRVLLFLVHNNILLNSLHNFAVFPDLVHGGLVQSTSVARKQIDYSHAVFFGEVSSKEAEMPVKALFQRELRLKCNNIVIRDNVLLGSWATVCRRCPC